MPVWYKDYFELKAIKMQIQKKLFAPSQMPKFTL